MNWQHEKTMDKEEAQDFSLRLTKEGETHEVSAVDENGNVTIKWGEVEK